MFIQDTTDEDSDFEEGYRRKQKPVKLKIKKEKKEGEEGEESEASASTESDWEPEADIVPQAREKSRSGRQRKRPSFFQEFESQENNLDSILAQFELNQVTYGQFFRHHQFRECIETREENIFI